jgi:hypothetical protein
MMAAHAEDLTPTAEHAEHRSPGTIRMAHRLAELADNANVMKHPFLNDRRAARIAAGLPRVQVQSDRINYERLLATDLLNSNQCEEALKQFLKLEEMTRQEVPDYYAQIQSQVRLYEAVCCLRQGELDNCLTHHTADSCIFPIGPGGVHQNTRGSHAAIERFTSLLKDEPDNMSARWLLNIAYMTLGEYPDQVPTQWLIPPKAFASEYPMPHFPDVAASTGLAVDGLAGGAAMEDFDGDDLLDIMVSTMDLRGQLQLFHNNGDGTFSDRTEAAGLIGEIGGLNLTVADYNNDGHPDVLVLRGGWMGPEGHFPKSLLRNNGDGTFSDVTEEAGLLSSRPTQTATWFDYNGDGWLDLFVGYESTGTDANPCELYRNNGDGTFTECAAEAGLAYVGFVKAVASGDFNNDGRPDLYLSIRDGPNVLLRNDGPASAEGGPKSRWKFTDVTAAAGVGEPIYSFPAWFWDYDNDGWPDILVTGYHMDNVGQMAADYLGLPHTASLPRLYHNNHDGTFTDVTKKAHLNRLIHAMGANYGDLDNDGWLDFYAGTGDPELSTLLPKRMFRNHEGEYFEDVTTSGGFGHLQKGHGIAFGDIDNDGDQDVFEKMGGAYSGDNYRSVLYENPGNSNHWLKLKLEGVKANRCGIGARLKLTVNDGKRHRDIYRTVGTGGSFGCSPLRQEIGVGGATQIERLEIIWPGSGTHQVFASLAVDQCLKIREGEATPVIVKLKTFKLGGLMVMHEHHHHE